MSTDYSYLSLKICVADGNSDMTVRSIAGQYSFNNQPHNPENLFVNAEEIYTFTSSEGFNVVTLWKYSEEEPTVSAALAIRCGFKAKPQQIIRLLRECVTLPELDAEELYGVFGFPPQAQTVPTPAPRKATVPVALRTFTSTSALADIVSSRLSGHDCNVKELIAVDATTVPAVDEKELPRLRNNPVPDFEIETPVAPTPPADCAPAANVWEDEEEEYVARPKRKKRHNGPIFIVLALVALAAGWAIVHYLPALLPESTHYDNIESTDVTELALMEQGTTQQQPIAPTDSTDTISIVNPDTISAATAPAPEQVLDKPDVVTDNNASAEKADIEYLNSNRVWKRSELKSDKYRKLFDSFSTGTISDIVNSDYFATEGVAKNKKAIKVADLLWKAKGTDTQKSNMRVLAKLKGKDEIDMHNLSETLAKYRSPKPNNSPRPKR